MPTPSARSRPPLQSTPADPPPDRWHVRVAISVLEAVPADLLKAWLALESYARSSAECWPGNAALSARMGLKTRAMQYALDALEDHGVIARRKLPGNRRVLAMVRRTSEELSPVEWAGMADRAARLAAGRKALTTAKAAGRKVHRPRYRIVG